MTKQAWKNLLTISVIMASGFVVGYWVTGEAQAQDIIRDAILQLGQSSVDTTATTNASVSPKGTVMTIDTWQDVAISTVNVVSTSNARNGHVVIFKTNNANRDVVFVETGNLNLSGTITLSDPQDTLMLMYDSTVQRWKQLSTSNNN